jgi:hypothetical protein
VYKLSKAGQAIDGSDFSTATSVLGSTSDNDWIKDVKDALSKVLIEISTPTILHSLSLSLFFCASFFLSFIEATILG